MADFVKELFAGEIFLEATEERNSSGQKGRIISGGDKGSLAAGCSNGRLIYKERFDLEISYATQKTTSRISNIEITYGLSRV